MNRQYKKELSQELLATIAADGSLTREGVTGSAAWNGNEIELSDGRKVNVALAGVDVVYPDGITAKMVTAAGKMNEVNGRGVARVNRRPDNRDEIISRLCNSPIITGNEGQAMTDDFLLSAEVA